MRRSFPSHRLNHKILSKPGSIMITTKDAIWPLWANSLYHRRPQRLHCRVGPLAPILQELLVVESCKEGSRGTKPPPPYFSLLRSSPWSLLQSVHRGHSLRCAWIWVTRWKLGMHRDFVVVPNSFLNPSIYCVINLNLLHRITVLSWHCLMSQQKCTIENYSMWSK